MIPLRSQAEAETRAALDGIVTAFEGPALPAELALVPMRLYGDALRLGLETPKKLRVWAAGASPALIDDVLGATLALLNGLVAPAGKDAAHDPTIATRLRERDHAESVLHAILRVWLPRPMTQLEAHSRLVARLGEVDRAFGAALSRSAATMLLGVRAGLGAAWAQSFADDDERARDDEDELLAALRGARPSPGIVARYVESGAMHALVERAAADDADFAEELGDTIEAMSAACQAGLAARGWQKRFAKGRAAAAALSFVAPDLAHAAASDVDPSTVIEHRLGALFSDVGAEATLLVGEREITLEIDFEPGAIALIELGSEKVSPRAEDGSCRIVVSRSGGNVLLRVRASSGQEISEELSFHTGPP